MDIFTSSISGLSFFPLTMLSILINDAFFFTLLMLCAFLLVHSRINDRRRLLFSIFVVLLSTFAAISAKEAAKEPRVCLLFASKIPCPQDFALPSTHAAASFALALSLLGTSLFFPALFFALVVSFSRIYIGVHSIGDVSGGLAIALIAYYSALVLWHAFSIKKPENTVAL
ncbi:Undecaprenyl-diphosphatase [Candidatus Anstonella stagnisolia]|nr:Undecaprenyl-diphosphatase [Candidatus Anstonella stagnisolia]